MFENFLDLILKTPQNQISEIVNSRITQLKNNCSDEFYSFNYNENLTKSFGEFATNENLIQISDYPEWFLKFDDEQLIYEELANCIKQNYNENLSDFNLICKSIRDVVYSKIGQTNHAENLDRYCQFTTQKDNICPISNFYERDISDCSERALIAHNLFKFLGVESYFMAGKLCINNTFQSHNYNIIYHNDKGYVFDLACTPYKKTQNGNLQKNPIVKELNEKEQMILNFHRDKTQCELSLNNTMEPVSFTMPSGKFYTLQYGQGAKEMVLGK